MVEEEDEEVSEVEVEEIEVGMGVPIIKDTTSKMTNRVPRMIISPSMKTTIKMMIGIHPKLFVTVVVGLDITRMVVP